MSELREVFLSEALHHQQVLGDESADLAAKLDAARGIEQAAIFAGEERSAEVASRLARLYADPAPGDEIVIAELLGELARALVRAPEAEDETRIERRPSSLEEEPTLDTTPPDTGLGLTHDELTALQSVFRDEASSHLEGAARVLSDSGTTPQDRLDALMRAAHSIKGSAATVGLGALANAAHRLEDRLESPALANNLDGSIDQLLLSIDALREVAFAGQSDLGGALARFDAAVSGLGDGQEPAQASTRPRRRKRPTTSVPASEAGPPVLRIDGAQVDGLLEDLGALVLDQGRLERRVALLGRLTRELSAVRVELRDALGGSQPDLESRMATTATELQSAVASLVGDAEALARAGDRLRRGLTEMRMQSAESLFERLAPHIRAAAREAGKRVLVSFDGGDARFDKAVAEAISDPLIHLVRNAVAHGIEDSDTREARGKPRDGTISLIAKQRSDVFLLDVSDDGAGIDPRDLRQRLVDSEQWSPSKARLASDEEVLAAIFDAGTTSRDRADGLAGRGVGLDAVRATIARLGGEVEVSSTPGLGTTFRLKLPLTTAVTNATTLIVGDQRLAIPSAQLLEERTVDAPAIHAGADGDLILVTLHSLIGVPAPAGDAACAVIGYGDRRVGLICDRIGVAEETVIKGLGPLLGQLPLCAGATITGRGHVTFVLDPVALIRRAHPEMRTASSRRKKGDTTVTAARAPARVLVADDSRTTRAALANILDRAGYVVDVAEDGERAWSLLGTVGYDALVTDIEMPGMSGLDLAERVRADPGLADIPIVVVTSRPRPEYKKRARAIGVTELLAKPVPHTVLLSTLRAGLKG